MDVDVIISEESTYGTSYYCREPEFHFEAPFLHKDHLRVLNIHSLVLSCRESQLSFTFVCLL